MTRTAPRRGRPARAPACRSATSSSWRSASTRRGSTSASSRWRRAARGPRPTSTEAEDDAFYVLEGELTFLLGDDEVRAPAGTFVLVPPGVPHTFANRTATPVRVLNIHAPAGFDRRLMGG